MVRLSGFVSTMLSEVSRLKLAKTQNEKYAIARSVQDIDRQIDQLVYELYGLTNKEIAIVEDATRND